MLFESLAGMKRLPNIDKDRFSAVLNAVEILNASHYPKSRTLNWVASCSHLYRDTFLDDAIAAAWIVLTVASELFTGVLTVASELFTGVLTVCLRGSQLPSIGSVLLNFVFIFGLANVCAHDEILSNMEGLCDVEDVELEHIFESVARTKAHVVRFQISERLDGQGMRIPKQKMIITPDYRAQKNVIDMPSVINCQRGEPSGNLIEPLLWQGYIVYLNPKVIGGLGFGHAMVRRFEDVHDQTFLIKSSIDEEVSMAMRRFSMSSAPMTV